MTAHARAAAETYRESVNTKDLDLLRTIFAKDVELVVPTMALDLKNPDGRLSWHRSGDGFLRQHFLPRPGDPHLHPRLRERFSCVVELAGRLPAGNSVEALDIFTTGNDGLVTRMAVYARIAS